MVERWRETQRATPKEDDVSEDIHHHVEGEVRAVDNQWRDQASLTESDEESAIEVSEEDDGDSDDDNHSGDNDSGDIKTDCANPEQAIALATQRQSESRPSFGNIVVNSSSDVHFGNRTHYHGPVTIKQIVYASRNNEHNALNNVEDNKVLQPAPNGLPNGIFQPQLAPNKNFNDSSETAINCESPQSNGSFIPLWEPRINDQTSSSEQKGPVPQWVGKVVRTRQCVVLSATISIFSLVLVVTLLVVLYPRFDSSNPPDQTSSGRVEDPNQQFNYPGTNNTPSGKLRIVSRREWLAQPPIDQGDKLKHPVPYVVILHTATENCSTQAECTFFVRYTQTFHIESNGWWDIGYNFLIGGDGNVYEGRGWDTVGAFAYGYNNKAIGIAFIGTFISTLPPPKQILAGQLLIAEGVKLGKISPDYKLLAHRQLSATESPGKAFYEDIQKWPHWAEKP